MYKNLRLGEVCGSYLLLIRKFNGAVTQEDESFLRGIICFFEYILSSVSSQEFVNKNDLEKCFKAFSTKNFLGAGFNELNLVIKKRQQELFVLKKTEGLLKIIKSHELEINLQNLEKTFCTIREHFQKDFLVDPEKGIMMVLDNMETIHTMSIDVVSNGTEIFHISF